MMRARNIFLLLLGVAGTATAQPRSLGVFGTWGAFRDETRCYAIARPYQGPEPAGWQPFAAIGHWPARGGGGQLHIRLSREKRQGSAVMVRIDGRSFQLAGAARDAWAPDARADDEIMAAIRTGLEMVVTTRAVGGIVVRDHYRLRGAATAMDAAALACLRS